MGGRVRGVQRLHPALQYFMSSRKRHATPTICSNWDTASNTKAGWVRTTRGTSSVTSGPLLLSSRWRPTGSSDSRASQERRSIFFPELAPWLTAGQHHLLRCPAQTPGNHLGFSNTRRVTMSSLDSVPWLSSASEFKPSHEQVLVTRGVSPGLSHQFVGFWTEPTSPLLASAMFQSAFHSLPVRCLWIRQWQLTHRITFQKYWQITAFGDCALRDTTRSPGSCPSLPCR